MNNESSHAYVPLSEDIFNNGDGEHSEHTEHSERSEQTPKSGQPRRQGEIFRTRLAAR